MKLWKYTGEELIGGAEITSDVILAPEIEMPWESDKVEEIVSMPNYATAPAAGHKWLIALSQVLPYLAAYRTLKPDLDF
jgi:hypothetical protein